MLFEFSNTQVWLYNQSSSKLQISLYNYFTTGLDIIKSSKYISKSVLPRVQKLETKKTPVREILKVLGVIETKWLNFPWRSWMITATSPAVSLPSNKVQAVQLAIARG